MDRASKLAAIASSGITINCMVACAIGLVVDRGPSRRPRRIEGGWSDTHPINATANTDFMTGGAHCELFFHNRESAWPLRHGTVTTFGGFRAAVPPWSGVDEPPVPMQGTDICWQSADYELCGWPLLCFSVLSKLVVCRLPVGATQESATTLIQAKSTLSSFPLRPILTPFLLNSLFWSLPMAIVLLARAVRRSLLHQAGRCVNCGYVLGPARDSPCTECGAKPLRPTA